MNNVNPTILKNFIIDNIGSTLDKNEAKKFDMEEEFLELATELDSATEIDFEDFSDDILKQFAVAYTTEQDKKAEAKDKEKQKEEQKPVKEKSAESN